MFRARAVRYVVWVKHCRSEDNSLGGKIWTKPHLKPQDLQGEFIKLIFLLNGC